MTLDKPIDSSQTFEDALVKSSDSFHSLQLYIVGMTPNSQRAIANIQKICKEHLEGHYQLEVIDLYQQPQLAEGEQIIAVPTLIKKLPLPVRRMIGDLADTERVLVGLNLREKCNVRKNHE